MAALLTLYGVGEAQRRQLLAQARDVRAGIEDKRLIVQRGATAAMQHKWRRIEADADLVREYHPALVVGELQTPAYAAIVLEDDIDSPAVRDRQARRQALLSRTRPRFVIIQSEGALRFRVGSAELMAEPLAGIIEAGHRPNVAFGLIQFWRAVDVTPVCGFAIHEVRGDRTAVVGLEIAAATLTNAADVAEFDGLSERLAAAAVWGEDSRAELRRIAAETT